MRVVRNHVYSTITVTWGESKISCYFELRPDYQHVTLCYQILGHDETPRDKNYIVPLVTTPCHFGGDRYWFLCPMYKEGEKCNRRVGVLYQAGEYFACRHCYELTYSSRNESRATGIYRWVKLQTKLEKLGKGIRRYTWRGRPTRRYRKYLAYEMAVNGLSRNIVESGFSAE